MATKKKIVSADTLSKSKKNTKKASKSNGIDFGKLTDLVGDKGDLLEDVAGSLLGSSKNKKTSKKNKNQKDTDLLEDVAKSLLSNKTNKKDTEDDIKINFILRLLKKLFSRNKD